MEISCVTVDCRDVRRVAEFWNEALGWGGVAVDDDATIAISGPPGGGVYLEFVEVPETKTIKNRVHLGCTAGELGELDAEIKRLTGLGATLAWEEDFPEGSGYRNVVLRDVEGNEFCLGARTPTR
jgi:catechol 2,3-dioxygenase-like lactoylglutathione lyase family enzyme